MTVKHRVTYEEYAALPDDGKRYEVLAGELYVVPAPSLHHQRVLARLERQLRAFFEGNELGEVFQAPVDVILGPHDVVQPDIVVVTIALQILQRAIEAPPTLAVEVLSPSSRMYDKVRKAERYLELGIEHYWIVDPDDRSLTCQRAEGGRYVVVAQGRDNDQISDPTWPDLIVDLADLWRLPRIRRPL